jgi:crotonobetainyl-CoA:carnitine CoA-transferase CaiB-like acyl-CoA transferase
MGPLDGVRVVEMGAWVAGPAAGVVLADWGADVVKIEGPGVGDPGRLFATILGGDLPFNPPFEMDNRNKRSAVVDVRSEAGLAVALDLIGRADVFLSNFRPAALERLGLGSEALLARNPGLVYGLITGYGLEGPDKDKAAYDIAGFWARAGIAHMLTQPGGVPPFQRGGMGDHSVGISTAGAICAALYSREKTGKGQLVATSLLRQGVYTRSFDLALALRLGVPLGVGDRKSMPNPVINNYCDKEGRWLWIVGLEADRHWPPLARALGHPEWAEDERFSTGAARAQNARELTSILDAVFATRTRDEWAAEFEKEPEVWWAPVQNLEEVIADPQVGACGAFCEVPDGAGTTLLPNTPADFHGTPGDHTCMAPEQGQHTDEVLAELGLSPERIAELRASGAVA